MPETEANGVRLYCEIHRDGEPLVLVHGSWVDATRWRLVEPGLAESLRVPGRRIADGDRAGAARHFVEEPAFGPGAGENELLPEMRAIFVRNASTCLDELQDPTQLRIDEDALSHRELPVRFAQGSKSPPTFPALIERLIELIPHVGRETIDGPGHAPQLTHSARYVQAVTCAAREHAPAKGGLH